MLPSSTMRFDDDAWQRWHGWSEVIKDDLSSTVNDQAVLTRFKEVIQANEDWIIEHEGGLFCDFVLRSYAARASFGIRRHVKNKDDAVSLMRLLKQMQTCAPQVTFDFFLQKFPLKFGNGPPWQQRTFGLLSKDGRVVSADIIADDIESLRTLSGTVETFADRALAHLDKHGFDQEITWDELARCIEEFNRVACKYVCFLTAHQYGSLEANILIPWERIFQVPFVKPAPDG